MVTIFTIKLTLNLLTTTIVAPPSNISKWQMGFNSAFKGLKVQNLHFLLFFKENRAVYATITKNEPGLASAKKNRFASVATETRQNV